MSGEVMNLPDHISLKLSVAVAIGFGRVARATSQHAAVLDLTGLQQAVNATPSEGSGAPIEMGPTESILGGISPAIPTAQTAAKRY
jgi:hypothetical protein